VVVEIFEGAKTAMKLTLNSADEEVGTVHITALVDLLTDCKFDSTYLVGTATILTGMHCTMASLAMRSLTISIPTNIFSREKEAAEYIAKLC
jgi:hypothetical protein